MKQSLIKILTLTLALLAGGSAWAEPLRVGMFIDATSVDGIASPQEKAAAQWFKTAYVDAGKGAFITKTTDASTLTTANYSTIWVNIDREKYKQDDLTDYLNTNLEAFKSYFNAGGSFYLSKMATDMVVLLGRTSIKPNQANSGDAGDYNSANDWWGINPYINYPFLRPQQMKAYADAVHAEGMKLKIYNTVRELTNHAPEVHALFSLGNEIFSEGKGGGYSWLQEHLDQNYIAAWFSKNTSCAAIVNTGVSRWHNFYMEGLDYLVKNIGIDGLYIDDLAFDRMSMKRIRKILTRTNPGALIDLHSANQYNPKDGFVNSATLYMEHFPYLDRLWFGEYFDYNNSPDFYLTEVSGIPFGLMGEMLQDGGNKWRGLLYGMTARMPWSEGIDNRPIWKLWDSFGMKDSEMIGYWVSYNPVKTNSEKTLATIYRHYGEKTLISIATWNKGGEKIKLDIDFAALGLDASKVKLHAPKVDLFQDEQTWNPGDEIMVPEGKGFLIVVE